MDIYLKFIKMNNLSKDIIAKEMEEFVVVTDKIALHHLSGWYVCFDHEHEAPLVLSFAKMKEHCRKAHGINRLEATKPSVVDEGVRIPGVPIIDGFKCKNCGVTSGSGLGN
jgi:hypothetical protein